MRWVIKIGSAVLSQSEGGLNAEAIVRLGRQLCDLHKDGHDIILVSSGAVAAGIGRLAWTEKPNDLRLKQSAAAVGQLALLEAYEAVFTEAHIVPAQILLTREDLLDRERYLNIRNTLMTLLSLRTLPIINENDSVATDEIEFGDNDTLAAIVAAKVGADRLVLLSDVNGFYEPGYEKGTEPKIIPVIEKITPELEKSVSKATGSKLAKGGMVAKLTAAKMATAAGIETWIASGLETDTLRRIQNNDEGCGTLFIPKKTRFASRHAWIAFGRRPKGIVVVDEGAAKALVDQKRSLLSKGVKSIRGTFAIGDMVQVKSTQGAEIGRGLVNFTSQEIKLIRGRHSKEIGKIIGRESSSEVIHRDNLVIL